MVIPSISLGDLSATTDGPNLQADELRDTFQTQEFQREDQWMKEQHGCLQQTLDQLKTTMEDLQKT